MIQTIKHQRSKKIGISIAVFFTVLFMSWSSVLSQELVRMNDTELDAMTGQAGFAFMLSGLTGMDVYHNGTVLAIGYAADPATQENGAWISLADIGCEGTPWRSLEQADARIVTDSQGDTVITMDQSVLLDVRNFHGSLRLGTEPGAGQSLGALHIGSLTATVSGTIRISHVQPGI